VPVIGVLCALRCFFRFWITDMVSFRLVSVVYSQFAKCEMDVAYAILIGAMSVTNVHLSLCRRKISATIRLLALDCNSKKYECF